MGKITLVTGGARSGKSSYAEGIVKSVAGTTLYLATAQAYDDEMKLRIQKHRQSRPKEWETKEIYKGIGEFLRTNGQKYDVILLDCLTIMVTNLLLEMPAMLEEKITNETIKQAEDMILAEFSEIVSAMKTIDAELVVVTNELGSGIVPNNAFTRIFRDIAGKGNQYFGESSQEAYLVVSGLPLRLK